MNHPLSIPNWWATHENSATRKLARPQYFGVPSGNSSNGYLTLLEAGVDGLLALAVYQCLCQLMATFDIPRRRDGVFADATGLPLPSQRIATLARLDPQSLANALPLLAKVGWVSANTLPTPSQHPPNTLPTPSRELGAPAPTAAPPPSGALVPLNPAGEERKGKERRGEEGKSPHPHSGDEIPHFVQLLNGIDPTWRGPVVNSQEASDLLDALPLLRELTLADWQAIRDHRAALRSLDPVKTPWPRSRAECVAHLSEVLTKALANPSTRPSTHQAGGRKGRTITLDEIEAQMQSTNQKS